MIIGIIGKKRSGKDTIADYLCKNHSFVKYSFADPMKKACKLLFNFTDAQLWGDDKEKYDTRWGTTARKVLQILGTEIFQFTFPNLIPKYGELIGRSHWVKLFEEYYEENKDKNIVISDVRFLHEISAIRKLGGMIWLVERDSCNSDDSHSSENEWIITEPDWKIRNNYAIESLYISVDEIIEDIQE